MQENLPPNGSATTIFPPGTRLWLPHAEYGYVQGQTSADTLVKGHPGKVLVDNTQGQGSEFILTAQASGLVEPLLPTSDPAPADLTQLEQLNNPTLLNALRLRFARNEIYTSIGNVLVSTNPYKPIPDLYSESTLQAYLADPAPLPPHIYQLAAKVYSDARTQPQTVIFSGESGSGKTEATKIFLRLLAHAQPASASMSDTIRERLLAATPLIEAFGNAQTLRNHNSSRFGTHLSVSFDAGGVVCGAQIESVLLEKTRVVKQGQGERNFHIFYQVASTLLQPAQGFAYIDKAHIRDSDASALQATLQAMRTLSIGNQDEVLTLIRGLLCLGQVDFEGEVASRPTDPAHLAATAALLGVDPQALAEALCARDVSNEKEAISSPLTPAQSRVARDSLAKHVYGRLFDWLVNRVNASVQVPTPASVALFDTFGFEIFPNNSFEQLCINYCNEKLQMFFNQNAISSELEVFKAENLNTAHLEFENNQRCLDLLESNLKGVLIMIDDELKIPGGGDDNYLRKLREKHGAHPFFSPYISEQKRPNAKVLFGIKHYAGLVWYDCTGFLGKNRDSLPVNLERLCCAAKQTFVGRELFAETSGPALAARAEAKVSRGIRFRDELARLVERIRATQTHFVRCIKPNASDAPGVFDGALVLEQLRSAGVLQTCVVRKQGYAHRLGHAEFSRRFGGLTDVLARLGPLQVQTGTSRVFLTAEAMQKLEDALRCNEDRAAARIQARVRGAWARRKAGPLRDLVRELRRAAAARDDAALEKALLGCPPELASHVVVRRAQQLCAELKQAALALAQLEFALKAQNVPALRAAIAGCGTTDLGLPLVRARRMLAELEQQQQARDELLRLVKFGDLPALARAVKNSQLPLDDEALLRALHALHGLAAGVMQKVARAFVRRRRVRKVLAAAADLDEIDEPAALSTLAQARVLGLEQHPWVLQLARRLDRLADKKQARLAALHVALQWARDTLASNAPVSAAQIVGLVDALCEAREEGLLDAATEQEALALEQRLQEAFHKQQKRKATRWACFGCVPSGKNKKTL